jgi:hypothetical protein
MDSELKIILAFVFKRSGKPALLSSELVLPLAMELHWFSLKEAKAVLHLAEQRALVKKEGDTCRPSFDLKTITIPVGFAPSQKFRAILIQEPSSPAEQTTTIMQRIVNAIASSTGMPPEDIEETINKKSASHLLTPEVSALLMAKKHHVDIKEFLSELASRYATEKTT